MKFPFSKFKIVHKSKKSRFIKSYFFRLCAGHSEKCPADWQCKNKRKTMKVLQKIPIQRKDTTALTRELNDNFRRDIFNNNLGTLIFTAGVVALADSDLFALADEVRCFEDFNESNDPYEEHDFGAVAFHGIKYFFKIDYYDLAIKRHSPDKYDPTLTRRTLTIMRADEY